MDFEKLLSFAQQVQQSNTKNVVPKAVKKFSTAMPPPRKEEKKAKGIQSEAVRAFLEKQKREEEEKAAKEREKKQLLLKAKLEAKTKADEEKRKEQEDAEFIPSNFASGPRKRVGVPITRHNSVVPTVNPCLVKAPNPCLVKAPNPCLVKASSSDKSSDSKKGTSSSAESSKSEKKHENKHRDKERHKHKHKDREKPSHEGHASKLPTGQPGKMPGLGVKTDVKGGAVKKIHKKNKVKKPPGKPPLSFDQLLQIAQKKHNVPVEMPAAKAKPVEEERPMTQEEKERYMRRHSSKYQAWLKFGKITPTGKPGDTVGGKKAKSSEEMESSSKHMAQSSLKKHSSATNRPPGTSKTMADTRPLGKSRPAAAMPAQSTHSKALAKCKSGVASGSGHSMSTVNQPGTLEKSKPYKLSAGVCDPKVRLKTENNVRKVPTSAPANVLQGDAKPRVNGFNNSSKQTSKTLLKPMAGGMRRPTHAPSGVNGRKQSGGYDATRETVLKCGAPAKVMKASSGAERAKPVTPWDRIYGEIQKNNPKPVRRKRVIKEEEEEEDSELDEFIADDDDVEEAGNIDVSSYIKDIFGYDKSRFRNERDDDLRDMESSFSQVVKEERMSARLGLKEDLEDIRREEEEKKRKMMKKAKKMKLK